MIKSTYKYWTFIILYIAQVPDGCKVRDKMLYSSSREDLKRALGVGYFTEEYSANVITDVSWESYLAFTIKSDKESVMTDTERLIIEENALTQKESTRAKSAAMGVLPFTLREGVQEEFQKFKVNSVNWIELSIVDESIQLEASKTVDRHDSLQEHIKNDSARFTKIDKFYSSPRNIGNGILLIASRTFPDFSS